MYEINRINPATPSTHDVFYIQSKRELSADEIRRLKWLISAPGLISSLRDESPDGEFVEIGPRLSVETPFSSNAVAICSSMGLPIGRIEMSRRFFYGDGVHGMPDPVNEREAIVRDHLDRMTQTVYDSAPTSFDTGVVPETVRTVPIIALAKANAELGLGMDEWDINYYIDLFTKLGRDPTDVELMQLGNANSEHSRHWYFRGIQTINGTDMPETLMDIVRRPLRALQVQKRSRSLVAFHDNAGVLMGVASSQMMARMPGELSPYVRRHVLVHYTATAETHNHPTLVSPFEGAETGAGGRIRDSRAVGRGGLVHVGFAGYAVGELRIEYRSHPQVADSPRRVPIGWRPNGGASALDILLRGSDGVSDYGNKIGEPLIGGFCRSFGMDVAGERREFLKPVLYSAGQGTMLHIHVNKKKPRVGMMIVRIGGPAYRIGVGGGSASSMIHGSQNAELDFKSVQRGNAEMENRVTRVIQACCELRNDNPIMSLHDQGAGGPSNVLTELMEPIGGYVDIRKITVGDPTMSVLELWVAEFQEGFGLLIEPRSLARFRALCARERVHCEILGEVTGDGNVVVRDSKDDSTPVNLSLQTILGELPKKRFRSDRMTREFTDILIPEDLSLFEAMVRTFRELAVGSKKFLTNKVDRSVTGLVARQQCCGPAQVPVSDVAVKADGYFGHTGVATAFGESPNKMLLSPERGARIAVVEMLTNMAAAKISGLHHVMCRANWMWAAKRPGQGAELYAAAESMSDAMCELGIAIDGGKDSLSMATSVGKDLIVSPGELVIMGYAPVPDIRKVVTPDLKGGGSLVHIGLGANKGLQRRLGGSALAQALGQLGSESPDAAPMSSVVRAFNAVQYCIEHGLISAYHDVSDGGLITTVAEMCIAGERGARLIMQKDAEPIVELFTEEPGMVIEIPNHLRDRVRSFLRRRGVISRTVGTTAGANKHLEIRQRKSTILSVSMDALHGAWEETSDALESKQARADVVNSESLEHRFGAKSRGYTIPFKLRAFGPTNKSDRPRVAIVREEGSNGDREMAAAFLTAQCEPYDVTMNDLLSGAISSLDSFRGVVFPGGFSFADVFGSAKGWAGQILFNPRLRDMFDTFYERPDTFSLGVCNGCQLMSQIGWLPYRGVADEAQPRFVHNASGRFESRWATVEIQESPAVLLRGMAGARLGIWVAHGEGRLLFQDPSVLEYIREHKLAPMAYSSPLESGTMMYPYNPNGSPEGWTALCSPDGRHLAMMPHPERCFLPWQWAWWPKDTPAPTVSPWLRMFQNARTWCDEH